jgi:photosystem II stability/assembly factor-like uncharacterized protein
MKTILFYLFLAIVLIGGIFFIFSSSADSSKVNTVKQELIPVSSITHGHGLSVDVTNPQNVYIATHHGLLLLKNDKDLFQVGSKKDDYMGFSPDPTNAKVFYSSGHPEEGGNIGFQKSVDGGFNWEKISDGVNGPVDFHAMAVSPANSNLIFGWYEGAIQRSTDGGKNWEVVSRTNVPVVNLTADPKDENVVYAASPQGLMVSKDKGKSWNSLLDGFVSTISINPSNSQDLISYSEKEQLIRSDNNGKTWEKVVITLNGETPLFIAFSRNNPKIVYLLTEKNSLYKSIDGVISWSKVK